MSISIEEARDDIDILEKLVDNPALILKRIFADRLSTSRLLYHVIINGKYVMDYFREYLNAQPEFKGCEIQNDRQEFSISVPAIASIESFHPSQPDVILQFDVQEQTYEVIDGCIKYYNDTIDKRYNFKERELDDFLKSLKDLSLKSRVCNAFKALRSKKKPWIRVRDFSFWLYMPKAKRKKISDIIEEEQDTINRLNKDDRKDNEICLAEQEMYRLKAPTHIADIREKQSRIVKFLELYGYVQDEEIVLYLDDVM